MKALICLWLISIPLAQAGLTFANNFEEVHAAADEKIVHADFTFTNRDEKSISISKVESSCSCLGVKVKDAKLDYAPGESGVIRAEFDVGNYSGTVDKTIPLWLKGDPDNQPSVILTVRIHIEELVHFSPKTLNWTLGDPSSSKVVHVKASHDQPIHINSLTSTSENFKLELKTLEEGKSYDIIVTPTDLSTPAMSVMSIATDAKIPKFSNLQFYGIIQKNSDSSDTKP